MQRDLFLEAMSFAAATVNIVTTDGPAGRAGVTVSAMCSVTADAPTLLVCVHHKSPACEAIRENGVFCVNLLRDDQALISDTFAGRVKTPGGDKFECADWCALTTGAPALSRPLVAFDCRLSQFVRWGTHVIFIGEVADAVVHGTGSALIYANRAYGTPAQLPPASGFPGAAADAPSESLSIGCFLTLGPYFMPQLVQRFAARHPEVEIELTEGAQDALCQGLGQGAFGLALTYEEGLDPGLERESLAEVSPYVLLPAAHGLAHQSHITLADLAEEPMVLLDVAPSRSYFTNLFRDAGYEPRVRYRSPSFETVRGLVGHGLGYALLATKPANGMTYDGKALVARPLRDAVAPSRIVVARRPGGVPTAVAQAFLDTCKGFFAEARAA
jgi:flavin reductase (DIM6/NTAB) family NADH-FMN oxidoreductase RutF/DNA-binding transcriptional LysR family regulator